MTLRKIGTHSKLWITTSVYAIITYYIQVNKINNYVSIKDFYIKYVFIVIIFCAWILSLNQSAYTTFRMIIFKFFVWHNINMCKISTRLLTLISAKTRDLSRSFTDNVQSRCTPRSSDNIIMSYESDRSEENTEMKLYVHVFHQVYANNRMQWIRSPYKIIYYIASSLCALSSAGSSTTRGKSM